MIEEMEAMVVERLQLYKARNEALPQRIIFYRNSVFKGQFDLVLQHELPQIQRVCITVYGAKDPRLLLSIIIYGKRCVEWPDENKTLIDTLEQRTHTASYSYARATRRQVRAHSSPRLARADASRSLNPPAY
jgi:hypothetical protein